MLSAITTRTRTRRTNGGELSEDDVFDVLSNRRRRFVIHALKRADGPLGVAELSERVTAWELGVDPEVVDYEDRRNVYSTLQRTHLPKLEEKNVVSLREDGLVEATSELDELEIHVEVLRGWEIPWSLYYVGVAGVGLSLLLAVAVGVPTLAAFSPLDVGVFTTTAFGVSAVAHHVIGRRMRLGDEAKPPELRRQR